MLKPHSTLNFLFRNRKAILGLSYFRSFMSTFRKDFDLIQEDEKLYEDFIGIEKKKKMDISIFNRSEEKLKIIEQSINSKPPEKSELIIMIKELKETMNQKAIESNKLKALFQSILDKKQEINTPSIFLQIFSLVINIKEEENARFFAESLKSSIISFFGLLTEIELSFVVWGFCKVKSNDEEFLKDLTKQICSTKNKISPEDYLNMLRLILAIKASHPQISNELYKFAKKDLLSLFEASQKPSFLTGIIRCLFEIGEQDGLIWGRIWKSLNEKILLLGPFELTEYLWTLAKMTQKEVLSNQESIDWKQINSILTTNIKVMNLNEINLVVWALNKIDYKFEKDMKMVFQERIFALFRANHKQLSEISLSQLCGSLLSFSILDLQDKGLYSKTLLTINSKIIHLEKNDLIPLISCLHLIKNNPRNDSIFNYLETFLSKNINELDYNLLILLLKKYPFRPNNFKENVILSFLMEKIAFFDQKDFVSFFSNLQPMKKNIKKEQIELLLSTIFPQIPKMDLKYFSIFVKDFGNFHYISPKGEEIMKYAEKVIVALIDENNENIMKKQNEFSCLLLGLSEYAYKSKGFWQKVEMSLLQPFSLLSLECKIALTNVTAKQFSNEFSAFVQQITIKKMKTFSNKHLIEQLRNIEKMKVYSIQKFFWSAVELEIIERFKNEKLDLNELASLLLTMKSHKAGSFKFWNEILILIGSHNSLQKINMKNVKSRLNFITLMESFRKNNKLSASLGSLLLPYALDLTNQNQLFVYEIHEMALSFSGIKIVDDQLWFNLESHLLKSYKTIPFKKLLDMVISFGKVKRGSNHFWVTMNAVLVQNKEKIDDFSLPIFLKVIEENYSFNFMDWAQLFYKKMEINMEDPEKFIRYLEEINKNRFLMNALKKFDCLKMMKHWKEKIRFNFEGEKKRQEIDKILMEMIEE